MTKFRVIGPTGTALPEKPKYVPGVGLLQRIALGQEPYRMFYRESLQFYVVVWDRAAGTSYEFRTLNMTGDITRRTHDFNNLEDMTADERRWFNEYVGLSGMGHSALPHEDHIEVRLERVFGVMSRELHPDTKQAVARKFGPKFVAWVKSLEIYDRMGASK